MRGKACGGRQWRGRWQRVIDDVKHLRAFGFEFRPHIKNSTIFKDARETAAAGCFESPPHGAGDGNRTKRKANKRLAALRAHRSKEIYTFLPIQA
jgi:hypothetical protein